MNAEPIERSVTPVCRGPLPHTPCASCACTCHDIPASKVTVDLRAEYQAARRAAAERATEEAKAS